ncbi:GntG family PLP-dependent aldolase [Flavihumibacter sp. CACIAM 22H1]|uniref:threonine aldolase family protein n=1 Tax=Flavihumibacter sp. CACIAM 22H1 TaxID=1812911 RepID=UPI0007A8FEAF|nr:GntG family PLP-dependent aldolase [Flavihumibacter sp. CACIAM 22H1]KYP13266.1 MAG: threonine aldolase [Flavihumibacter sp. CACIAM 22H1]
MKIDLRSDTFTLPTPGMLEAIARAEVGDDVFGEDPSVNELEQRMAAKFGMEAALFCPTGTMSNQVAINVHTRPGDEVICEQQAHVYIYEGGGIAFHSGSQVKALPGNRGRIVAEQVVAAINPDDVHKARTSLVCLENTSNRGGGSCYNWEDVLAIKQVCQIHGLALHLDGARLFNALVATGQTPQQYGAVFDSISVCFNKGMGCPIGSVLMGGAAFIRQARRVRKLFGGGMRQAGFMAAAALYALDHHIDRLQEDHMHARQLAAALEKKDFIGSILPVETNLLIFEVKGRFTAATLAATLEHYGVRCLAISPTQIRMVTHLGIHSAMISQLVQLIDEL